MTVRARGQVGFSLDPRALRRRQPRRSGVSIRPWFVVRWWISGSRFAWVKGMQSGLPRVRLGGPILLGVIRIENSAARDRGVAGADLVMVEWTAQVGDHWIAPLHVHHSDDEAWYVLDGELGFRLGAEVVIAAAGSAVVAPRGTPHTYWNAGKSRGPLCPRHEHKARASHRGTSRTRRRRPGALCCARLRTTPHRLKHLRGAKGPPPPDREQGQHWRGPCALPPRGLCMQRVGSLRARREDGTLRGMGYHLATSIKGRALRCDLSSTLQVAR